MGYDAGLVEKAFLNEVQAETIEEEVQSGLTTIAGATTTPLKVAEGVVASGYDAVVMGIAVEQLDNIAAWVKRADKHVYKDGLQAAGLSGLAQETPLFVKLTEKQAWELGLTNTAVGAQTVGWRIRIRHIKR